MEEYVTLKKQGESEFTDRKSVFLGHAKPVRTEKEATEFVAEMKKKYSDARHNVWAYALLDGTIRSSDDGEPSGTGGAPTLDSIVKRGLVGVAVVVTRYFGGILLGTGGLVHAYSQAASSAITEGELLTMAPFFKVQVRCPYTFYGKLSRISEKYMARNPDIQYGEDVLATYDLPKSAFEPFASTVKEQSAAKVEALLVEEVFLAL